MDRHLPCGREELDHMQLASVVHSSRTGTLNIVSPGDKLSHGQAFAMWQRRAESHTA